MNSGKTLFAQLMEFVPWSSFARIVTRYAGDARASALPLHREKGAGCEIVALHLSTDFVGVDF